MVPADAIILVLKKLWSSRLAEQPPGCLPGEAALTDIGITGGGKGNHMMYLNGVENEKIKSEEIISKVVSMVEQKAKEIEKKNKK